MAAFVVAGLLLGHALIHASYLKAEPTPQRGAPAWPFHLDRSWLLRPLRLGAATTRALGSMLIVLTIVAFGVAAAASTGVAPASMWRVAVAVGAVASLSVLVAFFHPWLGLGIVIDLGLIWFVVVGDWAPAGQL